VTEKSATAVLLAPAILEARDLNHAIQPISQLPGFEYGLGPIEIRPVADLDEIMISIRQDS
jgi:hypothetical protein